MLYLPWLPTIFSQARRTGAPWAQRPSVDAAIDGVGSVLGGPAPAYTLLCVCLAGAGTLLARDRMAAGRSRALGPGPGTRSLAYVATAALAGLVFAWLASQASPAWATRYLAVFLGPLLLVLAACLARAGRLALVAVVVLALFWIDPRTSDIETRATRTRPPCRP